MTDARRSPTDEELVARARAAIAQGDTPVGRRAMAMLYDRHAQRVRLRVGRKVGRNDCDDVASECWREAMQYVYTGSSEPRSFVAVLMRIVQRCIADHHRERGVERADDRLDELGADRDGLADLLARLELSDALAALEPRERNALVRYAAGEPAAAIGRELGLKSNAVYQLVYRARQKLASRRGQEATA